MHNEIERKSFKMMCLNFNTKIKLRIQYLENYVSHLESR